MKSLVEQRIDVQNKIAKLRVVKFVSLAIIGITICALITQIG